ncbi:hypothetical protein HDU87_006793 [Geranomyces variabilis]|uniref:Uncharacterized protein n=1 Tax=Geranomyces variabilis TaxID=109894 RepID=A0AAD5XV00_9FUNG|nr:hypothetical protein HDU87_006793 [Geranomyces variabilis]
MKFSLVLLALVAAPLAALSNPVPQSAAVADFGAPKGAAAKAPKFPAAKAPKFPAAKAPTAKAKAPTGLGAKAPTGPGAKAPKLPGARPAVGAKATLPGAAGSAEGAKGVAGSVPSAAQLVAAANAWRADTGKVSAFLNAAPTMSGTALLRAAAAANVAEKDELNHKAVIDRHPISKTAAVQQANKMLVTQGHFQAVVDALTRFPATGGQAAASRINTNRCPNVLPAIDAYLRAANQAAGGGVAQPAAIRPTACGGPQ